MRRGSAPPLRSHSEAPLQASRFKFGKLYTHRPAHARQTGLRTLCKTSRPMLFIEQAWADNDCRTLTRLDTFLLQCSFNRGRLRRHRRRRSLILLSHSRRLAERCLALLFHVVTTTWTATPVNIGRREKADTLTTADFGTRDHKEATVRGVHAGRRAVGAHGHDRVLCG